MLRLLLLTDIVIILSALASAFVTTGGADISCGNWRWAWLTLSRTSLAAVSKSASRSNSTVMLLLPTELVEVILRIPGTPLMAFSKGSVICDSITSELAPVYVVRTLIMGGSTEGKSLIPKKL